MRGFLAGVIWGGVVAGAGLAVLSQLVPLPVPQDAAPQPAEAPAPAESEALPKPPEAEVQPEILQKGPEAAAPDPAAPERTAPESAAPAPAQMPKDDAQADEMTQEFLAPSAVDMADPVPPAEPALPEAQGELPAALAETRPGLTAPEGPGAPRPEAAPLPAQPAPEPPAPDDVLLRPDPAPAEAGASALVAPDAGQAVETGVAGVTTDRLPRIGDAAEVEPSGAAEEVAVAGMTPLELFRRDFDNPEGKPLFAILLIDEGMTAEDRANLAALPFPVTFALDPLAPNSAESAKVYRQAGQEVAMLASGIPAGATATDLEQTMQALDMALPEAVVVLDRPEGGLQAAPDLARQLVPILAGQGRGLLTYDRGLNPADQMARRAGVPAATIFRVLDSEGESVPKMRNYLDRAAFKAAQEGRVLVIGRARAETVAAILEWTVEGRAATVALAPVSAVLERAPTP